MRVRLPNGQHITARLVERRRRADGTWWYVVTLALWSELHDAWGHHPAAYGVTMVVLVASCTPVEARTTAACRRCGSGGDSTRRHLASALPTPRRALVSSPCPTMVDAPQLPVQLLGGTGLPAS